MSHLWFPRNLDLGFELGFDIDEEEDVDNVDEWVNISLVNIFLLVSLLDVYSLLNHTLSNFLHSDEDEDDFVDFDNDDEWVRVRVNWICSKLHLICSHSHFLCLVFFFFCNRHVCKSPVICPLMTIRRKMMAEMMIILMMAVSILEMMRRISVGGTDRLHGFCKWKIK